MIVNQNNPLFTELITEEAAVVSGGSPMFVYDGQTGKILNVDGNDKEEVIYQNLPYHEPANNADYLSLPSAF